MGRIAVYACLCLALLLAPAQAAPVASYYVSATGNDGHDGLSETTALRSLDHAVNMASNRGEIKHIIVIGRLSSATPLLDHNDTGLREIVITGKPDAAAHERAVLTYTGDDYSGGIGLRGKSKIRFEHIEISGNPNASGLEVSEGAMITLGPGAKITRNHNYGDGGGVRVYRGGILVMEDGAEISYNRCSTFTYGRAGNSSPGDGGGISLEDGIAVIYGGRIVHNTVDGVGGGIYSSGYLLWYDGVITKNKANQGGGIYLYRGTYNDVAPYVGRTAGMGIQGNTPNDVETHED